MEFLLYREHRRFGVALAASLVLHVLVLCIKLASPVASAQRAPGPRETRLDVTLTKPSEAQATPTPIPPRKTARRQEPRPRILTAKPGAQTEPNRTWTQAERDDMDRFLNDLDAPKPRGRDLALRALAMAAHMPAAPAQQDDEQKEMLRKFSEARVDPFSIEMYFDALFRKMNRSATMIGKDGVTQGRQVAAVRLVVKEDGSVKDFRILWAADQQSEIAFIKAVVDQAAPFPVFPNDIRDATNSVVLLICIQPHGIAGADGATFSRMSAGQNCRG